MSGTNTNLTESNSYTIDGNPLVLYDLRMRVQAAVELMQYVGGTPDGRVNIGGTPGDYPNTVVKLEIDNPATTLYLNRSASVPTNFSRMLDYIYTIQVRGGATLTLSLIRGDHVLYWEDQGGGKVKTNLADYEGEYCNLSFESSLTTSIKEIRSTPSSSRGWVFSGFETNILATKAEK